MCLIAEKAKLLTVNAICFKNRFKVWRDLHYVQIKTKIEFKCSLMHLKILSQYFFVTINQNLYISPNRHRLHSFVLLRDR